MIDEAHKKGLRVAVHPSTEDAKAVLDAGADFIAHSVRDAPVDDAFIAMLKRRNVCYCPTLMREASTFVYESTPSWFTDPLFSSMRTWRRWMHGSSRRGSRRWRPARRRNATRPASRSRTGIPKKLSDAGVTIAMGTDTGPPARPRATELMELELMAKVS